MRNVPLRLSDAPLIPLIPSIGVEDKRLSRINVSRSPGARPREKELVMGKKIYVGNLSYNTHEADLGELFHAYGEVQSVKIITDRDSGNSKGFGFVEMASDSEASAAIAGMNGRDVDGRQLKVNEAMDKPRRDNFRY